MFAGRGRAGGGERVAMYLVESYHDYFIRNFVKIFFRIYLFAFVRYSIYNQYVHLLFPFVLFLRMEEIWLDREKQCSRKVVDGWQTLG